jgi:hypothetical protein
MVQLGLMFRLGLIMLIISLNVQIKESVIHFLGLAFVKMVLKEVPANEKPVRVLVVVLEFVNQ